MSEFDNFYWKHNDCLNKDTSLAHSFGEKVWNHQQAKIDDSENTRAVLYRENMDIREKNADLQAKIDELQEQLRIEREQGTEYFTDTHSLIAERDELQARVDVYELHIKVLKNIHENDFNEESESSYILGNLDGFFECIEADLKGNKDES